jgi:hypothetical protein
MVIAGSCTQRGEGLLAADKEREPHRLVLHDLVWRNGAAIFV